MSRKNLGIFTVILWLFLTAAYPNQVGGEAVEWNCLVTYRFGESLTIKGKVLVKEIPTAINLVLQSDSRTYIYPLQVDSQGQFEYQHAFQEAPLQPFATVYYWLEGVLPSGDSFLTSKKEFVYVDNRFPWKTRSEEPFLVHWRQGDLQFAQTALDVAKEAQAAVKQWLPLEITPTIEIYIYESPGELRQALQLANSSWVGAHADPHLGVVLVSVSEGLDQRLQMEQQIPHELMHIYLYWYQPLAYPNLPFWLKEGLATAVELYPNSDYYTLLDTAFQNGSLLSLRSLCESFPPDASSAYLAYAQSSSVVQFLIEHYGMEKIRKLIAVYADQYDCEAGFYYTYGFSLAQLEQEWQQARFSQANSLRALANLVPWGALLILLFVPVILAIRLVSQSSIGKE